MAFSLYETGFLKKDSILDLFFKKTDKYDEFISNCEKTIISYENQVIPSCKGDLIDAIKGLTIGAKCEINKGEILPSEYEPLINKLLANCTFDLLASGKYHIYRGMLNTMSCAPNLLAVHNRAINYALENNMITQAEKYDDNKHLMECISNVGNTK